LKPFVRYGFAKLTISPKALHSSSSETAPVNVKIIVEDGSLNLWSVAAVSSEESLLQFGAQFDGEIPQGPDECPLRSAIGFLIVNQHPHKTEFQTSNF
jgi:hypothetical protein